MSRCVGGENINSWPTNATARRRLGFKVGCLLAKASSMSIAVKQSSAKSSLVAELIDVKSFESKRLLSSTSLGIEG